MRPRNQWRKKPLAIHSSDRPFDVDRAVADFDAREHTDTQKVRALDGKTAGDHHDDRCTICSRKFRSQSYKRRALGRAFAGFVAT